MKTPKYLHVVLKNGTVRRFNYDDFNFESTKEYFTVTAVGAHMLCFTTPRENLLYFECNDDEYIADVRRY